MNIDHTAAFSVGLAEYLESMLGLPDEGTDLNMGLMKTLQRLRTQNALCCLVYAHGLGEFCCVNKLLQTCCRLEHWSDDLSYNSDDQPNYEELNREDDDGATSHESNEDAHNDPAARVPTEFIEVD